MASAPPGLDRLVLASGNPGKLAEFRELLGGLGIELLPQSAFGIPDAEETGLTFVENALIKARHASRLSGLPALADDSGLCVDALDGAPGLYSARYAGPGAGDGANNAKLLAALERVAPERRGAHYVCVLALVRHADDPDPAVVHGRWYGWIGTAAAGAGGFGYDPLFVVPDLNCSAAELTATEKHGRSHRSLAVELLRRQLRSASV
jgi:XTP/dITP diphosphohydrolase